MRVALNKPDTERKAPPARKSRSSGCQNTRTNASVLGAFLRHLAESCRQEGLQLHQPSNDITAIRVIKHSGESRNAAAGDHCLHFAVRNHIAGKITPPGSFRRCLREGATLKAGCRWLNSFPKLFLPRNFAQFSAARNLQLEFVKVTVIP